MRADSASAGSVFAIRSATLTMTSSPTCMPNVSLMTCSRSISRYRMMCESGAVAAPSTPLACRSNAWRVMRPVLLSYCAWMMLVERFASISATRVCCTSKSCALGGLKSASTPMTRSEVCRIGHARILYGAATSVATLEI